MKKLSVLTKLSLCATITAALLVGCSSPSKTETTAATSETAKETAQESAGTDKAS